MDTTQSAPAQHSERSYLPQLDAVRGLACLMVLGAHLKGVQGLDWLDDRIGTAGVGLFFALSGFLITRILISDKAAGRGLNAFYNRRAARILPIYFLLLAVLWFVHPGKEIIWAATFTFNLHYLTGTREYFHIDGGGAPIPPVAHVWSLCVEEHYYWIWPALVWFFPLRIYRWLPVLFIALTPALAYLVFHQLRARGFQASAIEGLISRLTLTQMTALSFGALLAIHENALNRPLTRFRVRPLVVLGVSSFFLSACAWIVLALFCSDVTRLIWEATLLHMACGGLLALGLSCPWLGRSPSLTGVGRISYGLYLFHLPIYAAFGLAQSNSVCSWLQGLGALATTFAVAAVSFRYIEAPILAWTRRRQHGMGFRFRRLSLSVGTIATVALAAVILVQSALWLQVHPRVPHHLRYDAAPNGYYWMGVFHEVDADGFRRRLPIPPRTPGVPRIATVGDSYTFGQCVESGQVIAPLAERLLQDRGVRVEVLNLGKCGAQAEDVLQTIRATALPHQTQVIVYAATVDDFKPSGEGSRSYTLEQFRTDPSFARRFRETVRSMNAACQEKGVVLRVMPFTQCTDDPDNVATVRLIQSLCRDEGVPLIDIDPYLQANSTRHFRFNEHDQHPNAECHRLYAELVAAEIQRLSEMGTLHGDGATDP